MAGVSTMVFDLEFPTGKQRNENREWLSGASRCLNELLSAMWKHTELNMQSAVHVAQLLEVIRRLPSNVQEDILAGNEIPEMIIPPSPLSTSSFAHLKLLNQLREDLQNKQKREGNNDVYEVVSDYEGIKQGLFPVDIAIKKNGQILGLIEIDGDNQYRIEKATGERALRRKEQLKEFLYCHDYPEVPFLRVDERFAEKDVDVVGVSSYCLSEFLT
jgi:hypothetical protein